MNDVFIIITCFYLSALVLVFISFQIEAFLMRRRIRKKGVRKPKHREKNSAELCSFSQFFKVLEK